jgi:hypothetical protein
MSGSCIHVTALLFRVEAANRNALTNPACTSQRCAWNVPVNKTIIQPRQICDMEWKAAKFKKGTCKWVYRNVLLLGHALVGKGCCCEHWRGILFI